ncbi:MAG: D-alanyl-D-alanine carboxypeptidase family protein [Oscillospiraceae bacterium]|nr:D-alanyl-D-alanine carboxypeptidase family protein [Oscillospiraceae bacterium]
MGKTHLNKGRLMLTVFLTVGVIVGADSVRRNFTEYDNKLTVKGDFPSSSAEAAANANAERASALANPTEAQTAPDLSYVGFTQLDVPSAQLSSGLISLIDSTHPAVVSENSSGLIKLADAKNEFYSIRYEGMEITSDAAYALNTMMQDYNAATGLSDFVVSCTSDESASSSAQCPSFYPESVLGNTVDLAVQGMNGLLAYDGRDEESWIIDNCESYGFIVRYPSGKEASTGQSSCVWHLRYVGTLFAAVMRDNNLCLEEFHNWIKSYTINTAPYEYNLNGIIYQIYYAPSMGDTTQVRVPVSGRYTISGNNTDGFVITAVKQS